MMYSALRRPQKRSISTDQLGYLLARSGGGFGSTKTKSGAYIGPMSSLEIGAHTSCIRLLAKIMAMIPCNVYRRKKGGGKDIADAHPLHNVLTLKANREMKSFQWQTSRVYNRALWGNTFDVIDRNNLGQVTALWPAISPNVTVTRWDGLQELTQHDDMGPGDLAYTITKNFPEWSQTTWPKSRILHIPGMTTINGIIGKSPTDMLRTTLGIAAALRMYEGEFFGEGIRPALLGKLGANKGVSKIREIVRTFVDDFSGWKSGQKLVIPDFEVDLTPVNFRLDYASLQSEERSVVSEICGFWGFHPTLIGHSGVEYGATYNNAYQFALQALQYAILPQAVNDQNHFDADLLTPSEYKKYFCKYDFSPLLQMDPDMMSKMIKEEFLAGALSQDEIREMRGRNPLPDDLGKSTYMQAQMQKVGEEPEEPQTQTQGLKLVTPENDEMDAQNE